MKSTMGPILTARLSASLLATLFTVVGTAGVARPQSQPPPPDHIAGSRCHCESGAGRKRDGYLSRRLFL